MELLRLNFVKTLSESAWFGCPLSVVRCRHRWCQAAIAATPEPVPYQWRVIGPDFVQSRILGVIDGCLQADISTRWTTTRLIEALSQLRGDIAAIAAGSSSQTPALSPSATSVTYDVLAMVDALAIAGVDSRAIGDVADSVGHLAVSGLDIWRACGVPANKAMLARRLLPPQEDFDMVP